MRFVVIVIAVCISITSLLTGCTELAAIINQPYEVTNETIRVQPQDISNANRYQRDSFVDMFTVGDRLFYYIDSWTGSMGQRSRFDGYLCQIENGEITPIKKMTTLFAVDAPYLYYEEADVLYAYNFDIKQEMKLLDLPRDRVHQYHLDEDGTFKFILAMDDTLCHVIEDGVIVRTEEGKTWGEYQCGEFRYKLEGVIASDNRLYCQNEDITDRIGNADYRALVPYGDSLFLLNAGHEEVLYQIDPDGQIRLLFQEIPCMCTDVCVNFYENYAFVSFRRWESYDSGFGMKRYENDTLEGTYRIDLKDGSTKKISDSIYNGMFIFDDSGIYCSNHDGDISKIDFDGNLLTKIVD